MAPGITSSAPMGSGGNILNARGFTGTNSVKQLFNGMEIYNAGGVVSFPIRSVERRPHRSALRPGLRALRFRRDRRSGQRRAQTARSRSATERSRPCRRPVRHVSRRDRQHRSAERSGVVPVRCQPVQLAALGRTRSIEQHGHLWIDSIRRHEESAVHRVERLRQPEPEQIPWHAGPQQCAGRRLALHQLQRLRMPR